MATRLTQAQMRRLSRRTGNIDQVAKAYSEQVGRLTSQFETSFGEYQQKVGSIMAPYEAAVADFTSRVQPQYERELAAYNESFADYQRQLAAIEADPVIERIERVKVGKTWYGKSKYADVSFFDPKPIPQFNAQRPTAPDAPVAPDIPAFDTQPFEQGQAQAREGFQREMAERRGSKLQSRRRSSRTMLSGTQA